MVDEVTGCSRDLCHLSSDGMKVLASFLTLAEAMAYIAKHKLDGGRRSAVVDHNMFTGKYDVLDLS